MLSHVMIDLETMGLRPSSAIVSIGAVCFNEKAILGQFYTPISLASSYEAGCTFDQSTVDWWSRQSVEARSAWQTESAPTLLAALTDFAGWLNRLDGDVAPWGNGADFDLVLLNHSFAAVDADVPWKFYNHHCFRTMKNVFKVGSMPRSGTYHNALDDAITQVRHLQRICEVHGIRLP